MGIIRKTETIYVCDRCGLDSHDEIPCGGSAEIRANISGRTYDGATGGYSVSKFLCGRCSNALIRFFENEEVEPETRASQRS